VGCRFARTPRSAYGRGRLQRLASRTNPRLRPLKACRAERHWFSKQPIQPPTATIRMHETLTVSLGTSMSARSLRLKHRLPLTSAPPAGFHPSVIRDSAQLDHVSQRHQRHAEQEAPFATLLSRAALYARGAPLLASPAAPSPARPSMPGSKSCRAAVRMHCKPNTSYPHVVTCASPFATDFATRIEPAGTARTPRRKDAHGRRNASSGTTRKQRPRHLRTTSACRHPVIVVSTTRTHSLRCLRARRDTRLSQ